MNLLDLFAIGFKSDGIQDFEKNLKTTESELDKAEKKVKSLEKELDVLEKSTNKDDKAIERVKLSLIDARYEVTKFGDNVKTMQGKSEYQILKLKKNFTSLMKTVGLLASVGLAVRQSLQFYEEAEQLDFLAQKTNIAIDSLQKLGIATQKYGGTTEGTASTVEQFTSKEFKEKALSVGVRVEKDNPEQTLENIAVKLEKLKSDADKWELAKSLGLDEGTTRLLVQGVARYREELKRANKYKLYTKEDIERMKDYRQIQQDIRQGVQTIQAVIARLLLPSLTAIAKAIRAVTDWAAEHQGGVKIAAIFIAVAAAIGGVILAIKGLSAAFAFLMANPVVLTIIGWSLAIAALIAIINDLIVFLQGGESVIGKILQKLGFDVDQVRKNCLDFFQSIGNWIRNIISWLQGLGGKIADFANKIKAVWDALPDPIKKLIGLTNPLTGTFTMVNIGKEMVAKANNNKLNSVTPNSISNSYQTQALTENNNANTKTLTENSNSNTRTLTNNTNKSTTVNIGTINTQAQNGKELANELSTIADMDNGLVA